MATITINSAISYQTMAGWEATAQGGHDYNATTDTYPQYPSSTWANYKTSLLSKMLDDGINRLRVEIFLSDVQNSGAYIAGPNAFAVQPSTATAGQWYYDSLTRAMDEIVQPLRASLAAIGQKLFVTLCVVDFRDGGYDAENVPSEYAFFVNKMVDKFYTTYGYLPDAIEAILEPNSAQNQTNWTRAKIANNIVAANSLLVSNGFTGIKWIAPSLEDGSTTRSWYDDMVIAEPTIPSLLREISFHNYTIPSDAELGNIKTSAEAVNLAPSMLEHIGADYLELHNALELAHIAAFQQYTIAFPYPGATDNGEAYYQVNTSSWVVSQGNRTKYLRHYFKYIRRGAIMCGVTNSSSNYKGLPFRNKNGSYVVPIKCTTSGTIDVVGLPPGTYEIRYTTGDGVSAPSAYDQVIASQTITSGQSVSFTMPAAGVVTVFNTNYLMLGGTGDQMQFWFNGLPFLGVRNTANDMGSMRFWFNGLPGQYLFIPSTLNSYLLTAVNASLAFTGRTVNLLIGRKLTSSNSSFSLSGIAAALKTGRKVVSAVGNIVLNGQNAALNRGRTIQLVRGNVSLTGIAAALKIGRKAVSAVGSFVFSGQGANLGKLRTLVSSNGNFTLSGQSAALLIARKLVSAVGNIVLNGQNAALNRGRTIQLVRGNISLTGIAASLTFARRLISSVGSVVLNGQNATLNRGRTLLSSVGNLTLSGQPAALLIARKLVSAVGNIVFNGQNAVLNRGRTIQLVRGNISLTGIAAALNRGRTLISSASNFALSGISANFIRIYRLAIGQGSFSFSGIAAQLSKGRTLVSSVGNYSMSGIATTLKATRKMAASVANFSITGSTTFLKTAKRLVSSAGSFSIAGKTVNFITSNIIVFPLRIVINKTLNLLGFADSNNKVALKENKNKIDINEN